MPSERSLRAASSALILLCALAALTSRARAQFEPEPVTAEPYGVSPAPATPDLLRREIVLRRELRSIEDREAHLLRVDREADPLTGAQVGTIIGFSLVAIPTLIAMNMDGNQDDDTQDRAPSAQDKRVGRALGTVMIAGMITGGTSLAILLYKVRHRPHRTEALALRDRRRLLERELNQVVRSQQEGISLVPTLSTAERKATLTVRYTF